MEKKVTNTRLAVALFLGLLLAGQEAAADTYAPATEAATATATATAEATPTPTPSTATDAAAEATPTTPSYGKASKADCEVPGTCDVKTANVKQANPYTRGCSKITGCRD